MKKIILPILFALLLTGSVLRAQQKENSGNILVQRAFAENTESFHTKPAMVKGALKAVVFGNGPTSAIKRFLKVDLLPIKFNGTNYYFDTGDYYIYNGGRFLLVAPPIGLKVKNLRQKVPKLEQVRKGTYYGNGIFYKSKGDEFTVVRPPEGAIIYNLPASTAVVTIDDEAYYEYLGALYNKDFVNGEQGFEIVGELTE